MILVGGHPSWIGFLMVLLTSTATVSGILPDEFGQLVVRPALEASIFAQVANIVSTSSHTYRVPVVANDPSAAWVNEGQEISPSDIGMAEVLVVPAKIGALSILSSELASDSSPAATDVIADGLGRDIARKLDAAMFGGLAAPAPAGLTALSGIQTVTGAGSFDNLDFASEAQSKAEQVGAKLTAFITSPATALLLSKLKVSTGSNQNLLGVDPTTPTSRVLAGAPLYVSPSVAAGTVWGIDRSRVWMVVRDDSTVEVDASVFFTSDRIAVRATMRVAPAFVHPQSVVKVTAA